MKTEGFGFSLSVPNFKIRLSHLVESNVSLTLKLLMPPETKQMFILIFRSSYVNQKNNMLIPRKVFASLCSCY